MGGVSGGPIREWVSWRSPSRRVGVAIGLVGEVVVELEQPFPDSSGVAKRRCHLSAFRFLPATIVVACVASCGGNGTTSLVDNSPVRFVVANDLIAPITILVDGSPYAILSTGGSSQLTVRPTAELTWTSAKPADANGEPIPDQIGLIRVTVPGINRVLEITNVIDDETYITARVFNHTTERVSIGVANGGGISCAAVLPAATAEGKSGFVIIGYYRLTAGTQVRAYRDPSNCTGPYIVWPTSALTGFEPKSGLVTLDLNTEP
jgi:hypothetical protein